MKKLEENTNYLLQTFWKDTFKCNYSFNSFSIIFNKRRPDGVQFIKDGIIIIENKKSISKFNEGLTQLKEYVTLAHNNFKDINLYGVLGFGTEKLDIITYEFKFKPFSKPVTKAINKDIIKNASKDIIKANSEANIKDDMKDDVQKTEQLLSKKININDLKKLTFIEPEEWINKYYKHVESYVIELDNSNKNEIETILKNKYNIKLKRLNDAVFNESSNDSIKDNYKTFINTYFRKSTNKYVPLKSIYKLAIELNIKGNSNFKQGMLCKIIPSSKVCINISKDIILKELINIFKNDLYIIDKSITINPLVDINMNELISNNKAKHIEDIDDIDIDNYNVIVFNLSGL